VSKGGDNSIVNLVTSCQECNAGKSDRKLSDKSRVMIEKNQLDSLQKRKEQIEMMSEWRKSLSSIEEEEISYLADLWESITGYSLTDTGIKKLKRSLKKSSVNVLSGSLEAAVEQYFEPYETKDSVEKAFNMAIKICRIRSKPDHSPEKERIYYIRGILRNRSNYLATTPVALHNCTKLLFLAVDYGVPLEFLEETAKTCDFYGDFEHKILEYADNDELWSEMGYVEGDENA